jgi:hypothetical protein
MLSVLGVFSDEEVVGEYGVRTARASLLVLVCLGITLSVGRGVPP